MLESMVRCSRLGCGLTVDEGWTFCPYCGQDNRPPKTRSSVPNCAHEYVDGPYCFRCGAYGLSNSSDLGEPVASESFLTGVIGDRDDRRYMLPFLTWIALAISIPARGPWFFLFVVFNQSSYFAPPKTDTTKPDILNMMAQEGSRVLSTNIWATASMAMVSFLIAVVSSVFLFRTDLPGSKVQAVAVWVVSAALTVYAFVNLHTHL